MVLCLTATLTEATEKKALKSLGLNPNTVHKIVQKPVSPRISFCNSSGSLQIKPIIQLLCESKCPRMIIFESSLVECGQRYLDFKEVNRILNLVFYLYLKIIKCSGKRKLPNVTIIQSILCI